jgi:guanine deaminase
MIRHCPDYYVESSAEQSLAATEALITYIRSLPPFDTTTTKSTSDPLVQPIITPRFALSCTSDLLNSLGKLAASDSTLRIQTHISENPKEVALTKQLFPNSKTYAGVYDDHGLLRENTILAHAVHLEVAEMELIAKRKAGVSHCPTSNFHLSSGVASVGEYLDRGIKVYFTFVTPFRY